MGRSWWNATKFRRAEAERPPLTPPEIKQSGRLVVGAAPMPVLCVPQPERVALRMAVRASDAFRRCWWVWGCGIVQDRPPCGGAQASGATREH